MQVPKGLKRCRKCGHYKGKCTQDGEPWSITCCCDLDICERCNTPVFEYKICSDMYEESNGKCYHVSIHCAWGHRCPDGVLWQLKKSSLINLQTGEDLLDTNPDAEAT